MVAQSAEEGHEKTHSPSSASSSSSSSSSASSASSASPPPSPRHVDRSLLLQQPNVNLVPKRPSVPIVVPTHFPPFRCQDDYILITDTAAKLDLSGFYWGPLGVEEAHRMLQDAQLGSFLIRDSRQKNVFFTLSYKASNGPVSVRIIYKRRQFALAGSERSFPSLFALLEHYIASPKRSLSIPYRKWKPTLQELCRKRIVEACGGGNRVSELPVNRVLKDFMAEFPYKL